MENFILYEEIGKGNKSIVYKGRRKGTIKFLSILCIDKEERAAVTNWVRLVHEVEHQHIVRFYEWYETTNHLWMVTELCTGGTLDMLLKQDSFLPEDTIRSFGRDILSGLFYLHLHGVVFGDLSPKKILVDGPGNLKLTNFCLSRLVDEDLSDVYQQASGDTVAAGKQDLKGAFEYQAPEIQDGGDVSMLGDVWAFGVIIYLLYTGVLPSKNLDDPQLKRNAMSRSKQDNTEAAAASDDFKDLLATALQKDVKLRPTVESLMQHPFWQGTIDVKEMGDTFGVTAASSLMVATSMNLTTNTTTAGSGHDGGMQMKNRPESVMDSTFTLSSRPLTANTIEEEIIAPPTHRSSNVKSFMKTSMEKEDTNGGKSLGVTYTVADSSKKSAAVKSTTGGGDSVFDESQLSLDNISDYIYHPTDMEVEVIQDNSQIKKIDPARWDPKLLPFRGLTNIDQMKPDDLYTHLKQVQQSLNQPANTSQMRSKANVASYLAYLCTSSMTVANYVINSSTLLAHLALLVKNTIQQSPDVACKTARVIGLAASCSTELEQCTRLTDVFSTLSDVMRENFRNVRSKQFLIPAIGQLLYFVAEQEEGHGSEDGGRSSQQQQKTGWSVPTSIFNLIIRCLREGEDPIVQNFACKTIQSVSNTSATLGRKFLSTGSSGSSVGSGSNDVVGPMLWSVSERSTGENLKHNALSALVSLNRLSGSGAVLQAVIDRVGLSQFFSIIQRFSYKCQQAIITAFVETLHSTPKGQAVRIANSKEALPSLMKFFDNPSSIVRAKIVLGVVLLLKRKPSLLVQACHNRLIMYIERDCRRISTPSTGNTTRPAQPINYDYIHACLNFLVRYMIDQAPKISTACVSILDEVLGRKHPSTAQVKQMKAVIPSCPVLYHMITSQVFRNHIVTSQMVEQLGKLLVHVSQSMKKSSAITSAIGESETQKFVDSVLSSVECLSQHPLVLTKYEEATMTSLAPQLINLLGAYTNTDGQMVCIKLITEVFSNVLRFRQISMETSTSSTPTSSRVSSRSSVRSARRVTELPDICGIHSVLVGKLIPELKVILQARDPLPIYAVRLLGTLLEHWPSLSETVSSNGLVTILLSFFDELKSSTFNSSIQELTSVLNMLVCYSADGPVMSEMYQSSMISNLLQYITEISAQYKLNAATRQDTDVTTSSSQVLYHLLNLLKSLLERVTLAVKFALQSTTTSKSQKLQTEDAEEMLVMHKPLTELQGICIGYLCDDQELGDPALACISLLVQLFGGDHPDTMRIENMNCFAQALVKPAAGKSQRILLKLLKRIVSLNDYHAEQLNSAEGSELVEAIRKLRSAAEKNGEMNVVQLTNDVLQYINN